VNGVTECPIPPGTSRLYSFRATQYGTTWYHSHFSYQYGNGLVGTIQINGPASANYDIDLGPYPLTDWYHQTADIEYLKSESKGPPPSDNVLFNGTNIQVNGTGGAYSKVKLTPGKKHRLRLINTSVENMFTVSLSGHNFTVIATDFVPVKPIVKDRIFLGVGQRYDVIIDADQAVGNYWFNATLAGSGLCGLSNNPFPAAIFSYAGAPDSLPTTPGRPIDANCDDSKGFQPVVPRTARQDDFLAHQKELAVNLTTQVTNRGSVFKWTVNGSIADIQWDKPILQYVMERNTSYPRSANLIELEQEGVWSFWVIDNLPGALVCFY
jgi:FtsP/CotA-like multicopper oxidase with cupredoxin domain